MRPGPWFNRAACAVPIVLTVASPALAHPAVGIVLDRDGAVFYSDTARVWRIGPDGSKSVAVPDVHTHELWLDADGALYGEHLWYEGDATRRWGHRTWRRTRDGRIADLIAARPGFREDYRDFFFARDGRGAMYWIERGAPATLCTRAPGGPIRTVTALAMRNPGWLSVAPDGTAFITEGGVIVRVAPDGTTRTLPRVTTSRERHAVMGVATDDRAHVLAAVYADRAVRKVTPAGQVTTVATSPLAWGPTGIAVARDGTLWILEASVTNAQRVRRVGRDGASRTF